MSNVLEIPSQNAPLATDQNGQQYVYPDGFQSGLGVVLDNPCCDFIGNNFNCAGFLHDATTGWYVELIAGECTGCCPGCDCASVFPLTGDWPGNAGCQNVVDQIKAATDADPFATVSRFFPLWALQDAGFTGSEHVDFDLWTVFCLDAFTVPIQIRKQTGGGKCPPGSFINAQGQCAVPDPPLPLAPDGNGFAMPSFPAPLPVHPVLSKSAIASVCGVCGEDEVGPEEWGLDGDSV